MLEYLIFGNTIRNYLLAIIVMVLFVGLGQLFSATVVKILKKLTAKTETVIDDLLVEVLEKPAVFALFIVGFRLIDSFITFGVRGNQIFNHITTILIVIDIIWAINKVIDVLVEHYLAPLTAKTQSKLDDHLLPFVRKFLKICVIVIGVIFIIKNMGYDVTSLIAGLGIGGLAFALAAQPLLSNLFGGLSIIADKPFQVGDRVRIDQKYEGTVKEIGMRSTVIKTYNDTLVHIPNNVIATTAVENLSIGNDKSVRFTFNIGVEYNTSNEKLEEAIQIIKNILETNKNIVQGPESKPSASFTEFKDSSLNIMGGYTVVSTDVIGSTRTAINLEIKKRFEKAHIKFAYPTTTIHMGKKG